MSGPVRALVTGGAGFIGSALVEQLVARGDRVTVVDDLSRGNDANLAAVRGDITFVELDIRDPELAKVVANTTPEVIYHLAAQVDVRASVADPALDAAVNVLGTINVAQAARAAGVRKIVNTSSGGSIYGNPTDLPVSEDCPIDPLSPYAASKAAAELYLNAFSRLHGLQCTHLAPANVYGPRQDPHSEAGVVAIFVERLLAGRPTTVFGDGGNTRDYVFVDDVARAFVLAGAEVGDRRRYNVGTGVQTSDRQLHTLVAAAAGAPDTPQHAPARLGDLRHSAIDANRASAELGWRPQHRLPEGIAATVAHFRAQPPQRPQPPPPPIPLDPADPR